MSIAIRCEFCGDTSKAGAQTVEAARKAAAAESGFLRPTGPKGAVDMCADCGTRRLDPDTAFAPGVDPLAPAAKAGGDEPF